MDKYCDTCRDVEAIHYDKTEFYVSLLDQQNRMWAQGKAIDARAVDSVISKAGQARAEAQKQLLLHRASHRTNETIHVERIRATYRATLTSEEDGLSKTVLCGGSEQLIAALGNWGASPKGIYDILKQLESCVNAELRLQ